MNSGSSHLRLYLRGYSGTAGRQSSVATQGAAFSTRDQDNDNCDHCKCALMLTGGKFISTSAQMKEKHVNNKKMLWPASALRLILPIRLVVWRLRFLQPQWDLLPCGPQHQEAQRHQMAPLQRPQLLPALHLHDGATLWLLTAPLWRGDLQTRSLQWCDGPNTSAIFWGGWTRHLISDGPDTPWKPLCPTSAVGLVSLDLSEDLLRPLSSRYPGSGPLSESGPSLGSTLHLRSRWAATGGAGPIIWCRWSPLTYIFIQIFICLTSEAWKTGSLQLGWKGEFEVWIFYIFREQIDLLKKEPYGTTCSPSWVSERGLTDFWDAPGGRMEGRRLTEWHRHICLVIKRRYIFILVLIKSGS